MSMAPKDGNIIKDGIAALLRGLVGSPGDTGGSTTAGTVMAKENTIMEMLDEQDAKSIRNMVWKTTETKTETISSSKIGGITFSFEKPVKFRALYVSVTGTTTPSITAPIYFINGENSKMFSLSINFGSSTTACYLFGYRVGSTWTTGLTLQHTTQNSWLPVFDFWITKLTIQIPANSSNYGQIISCCVDYQEGEA